MKKLLLAVLLPVLTTPVFGKTENRKAGYPITPVPFTSVHITGGFWAPRMEASRNVTIPLALSKCEESGRYQNFINAANPSSEYKVEGYPFDDTDVFKTIEGASYRLSNYPDKQLENYIDSVLTIVAAAQEPDGYLYTSRTQNPAHPHSWSGDKRWVKVEDLSHEFYNLGHMIEGAVAHWQATGKRNFLDIAIKYADCVCEAIGDKPGQLRLVPGHQIAEMALVRLYLATGDKKYLDQAKFFLEARGTTSRREAYSQSHKPVLEQDEAVGHAVRATYQYSGMADVAAVTGDSAYVKAIDNIWDNIVGKKLYVTGGIGATSHGEAFGANYELPNLTAYNETCAAIGNVYLNYRLFLLHGDAKYYDVLERTLYNGLISGVSVDGGSFFYPNPLASTGNYSRKPWFGCACCPSNVSRFIPSLPGYVYAVKDRDLYVNLYLENNAEAEIGKNKINVSQQTNYPWDGNITFNIDKGSADMALNFRLPGWVNDTPVPSDLYSYADAAKSGYKVLVNGKEVLPEIRNGYLVIDRKWKKGDKVELAFEMPVRMVKAHDAVAADKGRIAIERGPVVYCAEWPDNDFNIHAAIIGENPEFAVTQSDEFNGINRISAPAQVISYDTAGKLKVDDCTLNMIPYYSWAHRGEGDMTVWLPTDPSAVSVKRPVVQKQESNGFFEN